MFIIINTYVCKLMFWWQGLVSGGCVFCSAFEAQVEMPSFQSEPLVGPLELTLEATGPTRTFLVFPGPGKLSMSGFRGPEPMPFGISAPPNRPRQAAKCWLGWLPGPGNQVLFGPGPINLPICDFQALETWSFLVSGAPKPISKSPSEPMVAQGLENSPTLGGYLFSRRGAGGQNAISQKGPRDKHTQGPTGLQKKT